MRAGLLIPIWNIVHSTPLSLTCTASCRRGSHEPMLPLRKETFATHGPLSHDRAVYRTNKNPTSTELLRRLNLLPRRLWARSRQDNPLQQYLGKMTLCSLCFGISVEMVRRLSEDGGAEEERVVEVGSQPSDVWLREVQHRPSTQLLSCPHLDV